MAGTAKDVESAPSGVVFVVVGTSGAVVGSVEGLDLSFFVPGLAEGDDFPVPGRVSMFAEEPLGDVFVFKAIRCYQEGL
jgi:hypothetical protein